MMREEQNIEVAVFAGGCFWCTEAVFDGLKGVISAVPGYSGGKAVNPTYEEVSEGTTGHAESIKIEFDPAEVTYKDLLTVFFATHDPTTIDRQGNDVGSQYRSVVFFMNEEQRAQTQEYIKEAQSSFSDPIVTEVRSFEAFYEAEDYHKRYYETHKDAPYCRAIIDPKLEKLQKQFAELLKTHKK